MAKRILLADDSAAVRKSLEKTLDLAEYQLNACADGRSAMEQVNAVRPHLVLAHAMLPEIDGYEVCRQVKGNPETSHIPVLLLTGTFEPFDINRAKEVGYDGFVTKPLDGKELLGLMTQVIGRAVYPAEEPEPQQEPEALPEPEPDPVAEEPPAPAVTEFPVSDPEPGPEQSDPSVSEAMLDRIFPEESDAADAETADEPAEELFTVMDQPEESAPATTEFGAWSDGESESPAEDPGTETLTASPAADEKTEDEPAPPTEDSDLSWFLRKFEEKAQDDKDAEAPAVEPEAVVAESPADDDPFAVVDDGSEPLTVDEPEAVEETVVTETPVFFEEQPVADEPEPAPADEDAEDAPATAAAVLGDDQLEQVARRVVEMLSESVIRDVVWEAVPEIAERLIRERIQEIEAEAETPS